MANLASGRALWRALYPSRCGFEGGGVGVSSLVVMRASFRGSGRRKAGGRTMAGVATSCRLVPPQRWGWCCSAQDGGAVAGMVA
jgi:hypothetical protein